MRESKNFNIPCTETSNKVANIKQYERYYSFIADEEWIRKRVREQRGQIAEKYGK